MAISVEAAFVCERVQLYGQLERSQLKPVSNYLRLGQVEVGSKLTALLADHVAVLFKRSFQMQQLSRRERRPYPLRLPQ